MLILHYAFKRIVLTAFAMQPCRRITLHSITLNDFISKYESLSGYQTQNALFGKSWQAVVTQEKLR